jgi:hypothetical protein
MPADIHDYCQLPAVCTTQVTPKNYQQGGIITTTNSTVISSPITVQQGGASFQLSTQDNNNPGSTSNYGWQQVAAVGTLFPPQSPFPSTSPGVIGSGAVAIVSPPITSASPINTPSPGLTAVTAQLTTQVNPFPGTVTSNSIVAEQQLAVIGPVYYSDGGILNVVGPANSNLTTGGGP